MDTNCRPDVDPNGEEMVNISLTKKFISSVPLPDQGKRLYYRDSVVPELELMVTSAGTKVFNVNKRINDKPTRVKLGKFPDITIEQARKEARRVLTDIASGVDPNNQKRLHRDSMTLEMLFIKYLCDHAELHCTNRSLEEMKKQFRYAASLHNNKLVAISTNDIKKVQLKIASENGKVTSNRVVSLLSAIFNRAIKWDLTNSNPTLQLDKFKETSRDRFLSSDELKRFFAALDDEQNKTMRDYFSVSLFTGARRNNVLAMKWVDIDLEQGIWRIASNESKNREVMKVALIERVIEILQGRLVERDDFLNRSTDMKMIENYESFVFPSTGVTGHIVEPKSAWKRISNRANITDLKIHDLRRTLGSYQAMSGASTYVIGKSLGHKSHAATAIYARVNLDPVRASLEKASTIMNPEYKSKTV